ncbi:alpha/beta fold hydrolase [Streptomyces sp. WMMC500]|uniref:alpha/beta fold hydrolase n=1 Tax=Streptomyces sp. WMMC500 TaxID=3015154 RepID=UPI00248C2917|nr:alpha/beta fold hydrolase [Streptomyces sp. WMMC500]WBB61760.1 alpha/beta fold hydrolase [Streptomyces sp. WMMC500]
MVTEPDTLVVGATGLIGRWLTAELLTRGRSVAATVRGTPARDGELRDWLREHEVDDRALTVLDADVTRPDLALAPDAARRLTSVRDVYNTAALFRFALGRDEARRANVDGALHVLHHAARLPRLRRLVHVSGYRVSGAEPLPHPAPEGRLARLYRHYGAYEASKHEADAALRAEAAASAVPLTLVNPATVIGHARTGEAGQHLGLADMVEKLWTGRLPALAGTRDTFVPVVTVDHLARFMAAVPAHDREPLHAHWVLDPATPELPELIALLARHLGVRAPRAALPVGLVRRLPRALTRTEPETLTFLSDDRYDTASADALAEAAGLSHPPVADALCRWADRLVAERFGAARPPLPGGMTSAAGTRTYVAGDRRHAGYVLLHGLPLNAETWQGVLPELDGTALLADLPGLGRSAPPPTPAAPTPGAGTCDAVAWLADLLAPLESRPVLVAHSAAAAPALRYAHAHPHRIGALVLVSPYFLQPRPGPHLRTSALTGPLLRSLSTRRLGSALLGAAPRDPDTPGRRALDDAVAHLRRPGAARRAARWLARAQRPAERAELRALTVGCPVPVRLVVGEHDPPTESTPDVPVTVVPGAGHHPQLSHPAQVAAAIRAGVPAG